MSHKMPRKRFVPLGDDVAVSLIKEDETPGGVILPDGSVGAWTTPRAVIVATGPDVKQVKEGDTVLIHPSAIHTPVNKVKFGGDDYIIIKEKALAGILIKES